MRPSFIAAGINGVLMLIVIVSIISYWGELSNYEKMVLMSLLAIQIGLHALLHHVEEIYYHFNPLENQWNYDKAYST
jgi:hypothetical protein